MPEDLGMEKSTEEKAAELLKDREETVATAESATGGLAGSKLTDVPGASDYFDRAVVTYSHRAKQQLAGVDKEALEEHSAVSQKVASQMAKGVRDLAQTEWGISITGYAGPESGPGGPVGKVYIGIAYSGNEDIGPFNRVNEYIFDEGRKERKEDFAEQALKDLCEVIKELREV